MIKTNNELTGAESELCSQFSSINPTEQRTTSAPVINIETVYQQLDTLLINKSADQQHAFIKSQIKLHLSTLFEPDDTFEYRKKHSFKINSHTNQPNCYSDYYVVGDLLNNQKLDAYALRVLKDVHQGYHAYISLHNRYFDRDFFTRNQWKGPKPCSKGFDTKCYRCFALDVDYTSPAMLPFFLMEHSLPVPTLTVVTGYGLQLYWRLDRPISRLHGEDLFKLFVKRHSQGSLKSDAMVSAAAQIMRHPGTVNHCKIHNGAVRSSALAFVLTEQSSGEIFSIHDLMPGLLDAHGKRVDVEGLYEKDAAALVKQLESWNYLRNKPWMKKPDADFVEKQTLLWSVEAAKTQGKTEKAKETPKKKSTPTWKKKVPAGVSVIDRIINYPTVQVSGSGERHGRLPFLVAAVRYHLGSELESKVLEDVHSQWFDLYEPHISSSKDASFADFIDRWGRMPAADDSMGERSVTGIDSVISNLEDHPEADKLSGKRYESARILAAVIWTAAMACGFADGVFYLSCEKAAELAGLADKKSASKLLNLLVKLDMVERTEKGKRNFKTGESKASFWNVPVRLREVEAEVVDEPMDVDFEIEKVTNFMQKQSKDIMEQEELDYEDLDIERNVVHSYSGRQDRNRIGRPVIRIVHSEEQDDSQNQVTGVEEGFG